MGTSAVPALIDAISTTMTAAFAVTASGFETVRVLDGPQLDPGDSDTLQVGVDDPEAERWTAAAVAGETPGPFSTAHPRDERGEVILVATAWNGDSNMKLARDRVYAIAGAVANQGRTANTWGVTGLLWTGYGSASGLEQLQNDYGAHAVLRFRISFRARI